MIGCCYTLGRLLLGCCFVFRVVARASDANVSWVVVRVLPDRVIARLLLVRVSAGCCLVFRVVSRALLSDAKVS